MKVRHCPATVKPDEFVRDKSGLRRDAHPSPKGAFAGRSLRTPTRSRSVGFFCPFSALANGRVMRRILLWLVLAPALLSAEVRRVVTLVPSHTDIVEALGLGERLVGVADADKGRETLPRAGGLAPRWEVLVSLKPDLVLADLSHRRFAPEFQRHKIPVRFFAATRAGTLQDVFAVILEVGDALERPAEARRLVSDLTARTARIDDRLPPGQRPRAIFELWPRPLQVAGRGSLPGHLLERAGFVNVAPETRGDTPLLSTEFVLEAKPDYIFHTGVVPVEEIKERAGWNALPAVEEGRVIYLDPDLFSRAGPRAVEALEILMKWRRGEME